MATHVISVTASSDIEPKAWEGVKPQMQLNFWTWFHPKSFSENTFMIQWFVCQSLVVTAEYPATLVHLMHMCREAFKNAA